MGFAILISALYWTGALILTIASLSRGGRRSDKRLQLCMGFLCAALGVVEPLAITRILPRWPATIAIGVALGTFLIAAFWNYRISLLGAALQREDELLAGLQDKVAREMKSKS
jgi:hypothetical protein